MMVFTKNCLKFSGSSTAMMLLFLSAVSAKHEESERSKLVAAPLCLV